MADRFTVGDIARQHSLPLWKVRRALARAVARGYLAEPAKAGRYRIFPADCLPAVERILRDAGYLATPAILVET